MGTPPSHARRGSRVPSRPLLAVVLVVASLASIPVVTAAGTDNDKKVRICHATSSQTNPYVSQSPAIANNGDLQGGHLNHTGPVYPADGWGDIIPPYDYVDKDGNAQTFPGSNWSTDGQAIWENDCEPPAPPQPPDPEPITPSLDCVEPSGSGFLAHFTYDNPNSGAVTPDRNRFSPPPESRGQPTTFEPGTHDVPGVPFDGDVTWELTTRQASASSSSRRCQGSLTVIKNLDPEDDPGRFDLEIDGDVAGTGVGVGNGGTTGTIDVDAGSHVVSESAAAGTSLDRYTTAVVCRSAAGAVVAEASQPSVTVTVSRGQAIMCTITNVAKPKPDTVTPRLECVAFHDGAPDVAYWGYRNTNGHAVEIPIGDRNRFDPVPRNRGQPTTFEKGSVVGQFGTAFDATTPLTWTVSGESATASGSSPPCTATVELRKVVQPADDPGVFVLEINDRPVVTGGNGTSTGPLVVGIGEGTASEVAAQGTTLADYDSRVDCTRNGQPAASATGTKIDGAIARGDVVVCTFTNVRKGTPPIPPTPPTPPVPPTPPTPPTPPLPPTPPEPPLLDLVVTKSARPTVVDVGGRITWTMTVTNRSTVEATDVNGLKVDDPRSFRTRLVSLRASQGTCRPYTCNLGRLAPGASATVVAVSEATEVGPVVNIVRVGSEEQESNYRNNVAAALVRVVGPLTPPRRPNRCDTLVAEPRALQTGRSSVVRLTARDRRGQPVAGVRVLVRGPGVDRRVVTDRRGVARVPVLPAQIGLVHFVGSPRTLVGGGAPCRTLLGVLGASGTQVTG